MRIKMPIYCMILYALCILFFSCSQKGHENDGKILAWINDHQVFLEDFQYQLAQEINLDSEAKLTRDVKKNFLERLIKKELLIQEAKKRRLDRREDFIEAIERYWEAILIRDLLELKGRQISERILISQEEIEAYYNDMKKADVTVSSLKEMEKDITNALREEKESRILKEWMDELQKRADIEINEELLYSDR